MADNDNSNAVWFLAGAAIGAAVALLFAPQSGSETRRIIRRRAEEGRDLVSERGQEIAERGRDLYERGRKIADEAAEIFDRGKKLAEG